MAMLSDIPLQQKSAELHENFDCTSRSVTYSLIQPTNSLPNLRSAKIDGRIAPRSGLAVKNFIDTGAGVIDADYRGQVKILLFNHSDVDFEGLFRLLLLLLISLSSLSFKFPPPFPPFPSAIILLLSNQSR